MLQAVLFDMDGVMVNSEWVYMDLEKKLTAEFNIPFTEEFQKKYYGLTMNTLWRDLINETGVPYTAEEMVKKERAMLEEFFLHGPLEPIKNTPEAIHALAKRGVTIGIATSNIERIARIAAQRIGVENEISFIASADKVKALKPAPDLFLLAAEALGVDPAGCVAIDDSVHGIVGAKAAGMKAIGFISPFSEQQDFSMADHVTDDMGSLTYELICGLFE